MEELALPNLHCRVQSKRLRQPQHTEPPTGAGVFNDWSKDDAPAITVSPVARSAGRGRGRVVLRDNYRRGA